MTDRKVLRENKMGFAHMWIRFLFLNSIITLSTDEKTTSFSPESESQSNCNQIRADDSAD